MRDVSLVEGNSRYCNRENGWLRFEKNVCQVTSNSRKSKRLRRVPLRQHESLGVLRTPLRQVSERDLLANNNTFDFWIVMYDPGACRFKWLFQTVVLVQS